MDPLLLLFQMGMIVIGLMGLNNGMKLIMVDYFGKYCHSNDVFFLMRTLILVIYDISRVSTERCIKTTVVTNGGVVT